MGFCQLTAQPNRIGAAATKGSIMTEQATTERAVTRSCLADLVRGVARRDPQAADLIAVGLRVALGGRETDQVLGDVITAA